MDDLASQLCSVDGEDRVSLPVNMLRQMSWWASQSCEVIAEMTCVGLVRITSEAIATPVVVRLRGESATATGAAHHDRRMALADKFRRLKLYKDGRLRLTAELFECLELEIASPGRVLVQPAGRALEIMSRAFWASRLAKYSDATIGAHTEH